MFRTMRNKVTTMLQNSKQGFFNRNVNTTNKKQFWKTVKYRRLDKSTILTVSLDDNQAINHKDKSTMLNSYNFSDCFSKSLPPLDVPPETFLSEVNPNTIEELLCTEEVVLQLHVTNNRHLKLK